MMWLSLGIMSIAMYELSMDVGEIQMARRVFSMEEGDLSMAVLMSRLISLTQSFNLLLSHGRGSLNTVKQEGN